MQFTLLIIVVFSILGLIFDTTFILVKPFIPLLLSVIMFFMGITLTTNDFKKVIEKWKLILVGTSLQFVIMPLLALIISQLLQLSVSTTIGMVLVGACPGGTASNVIVFLGKGNVALSVSLTLVSTLVSPIITPFLLDVYLGESIRFDLINIMLSIGKIVILPIGLGLSLNHFFANKVQSLARYSSQCSSLGIALIIGCVLALNKETILKLPLILFAAVVLHNLLGFLFGYFGARLFSSNNKDNKTIAIEVGMQNSGLAVALANQFFISMPLATLPGAIFSFWHNISGVLLTFFTNQKKH